jgi:hypothetical protein
VAPPFVKIPPWELALILAVFTALGFWIGWSIGRL